MATNMQLALFGRLCCECSTDISHRATQARRCEDCVRKAKNTVTRAWSQRNKERVRANQQAWAERNPGRMRELQRAWAVRNAERRRDGWSRRQYGLSLADRDAMLAAQNDSCAICGTKSPGRRGWNVDHCHATGEVRGILCGACNVGIGQLRDDPAVLLSAYRYLMRTPDGDV
jgi:Recombination endonuclease VII